MSTQKDDLDKIGDVLFDFFRCSRIVKSLEDMHEVGISGWEKWWQIELAIYLANADSIAEWDMEHPFDTDKRTSLKQNRMALDIGFRIKRHNKNEWLFVELKQNNNYIACINNMCKDVEKVFSARTKSFDGLNVRFIACAGVFLTEKDDEKVLDYAEEALDRIGVDSARIYLEKVGKHHSLLIF